MHTHLPTDTSFHVCDTPGLGLTFSTGSSETHNDDDDITTSHRIFSTFFYLLPPSPSGTLGVSCVQSQLGAATVLSPAYRSQLGAASVSRSPHRVVRPTYIDAERSLSMSAVGLGCSLEMQFQHVPNGPALNERFQHFVLVDHLANRIVVSFVFALNLRD